MTRFKSFWTRPTVPAKNAVNAPKNATINKVELLNLIGSKCKWNSWKDNERLNVHSRKSNGKKYSHKICSYFVRLPSKFDGQTHKNITQKERTQAVLKLININK